MPSQREKLKSLLTIKGVRDNSLVGYGVVVGLNQTGDSSVSLTNDSLVKMLGKLGVDLQNKAYKTKNAASVLVTCVLPPFARSGNKYDVTVSSMGDASSLQGGILIATPLEGGNAQVYMVAQGPVSIGSVTDGSTKNFPTVGTIIGGGTVEKELDLNFSEKISLRFALKKPGFTLAYEIAQTIDVHLGGHFANALDSGTIDLIVPERYRAGKEVVELIAMIENLEVETETFPKIIINERTGTVVMGGNVKVSPVAIAQGDLTIEIQKGASSASKNEKGPHLLHLDKQASVADLVKALNTLGTSPKDLTAIFQSLKLAGALQADLEIK